ncbi:MAG: hypothetical protein V4672_16345 [Verrucomicrobiota bacterium]
MGDAVSRGPGGLATALAETARFLNQKQPGLINERTHLFTTVEELLASYYARQYPFTAEQIASLRSAEGFHDTETGHSFVIAENTRLLPGESTQQALTRVVLHERVGHGGLHILLGNTDSARSRRWAALSAQIPPAELEAIAGETGYGHLAGKREDLAFEWFARRTEKDLNLLEKDSLPRQMWDAFREMALDFMARVGLRPTLGRSFETQVKDLQRRAREAALRPVRDRTNVRQVAPSGLPMAVWDEVGAQAPQASPDPMLTGQPPQAVSNRPEMTQATAQAAPAAQRPLRGPETFSLFASTRPQGQAG